MFYRKLLVLLLVTVLPIRQATAINNGSAVAISLATGIASGFIAGIAFKEDARAERAFVGDYGYRRFRNSDASVAAIAGITVGVITTSLTYLVLYHSCVNAGPCSMCGERKNSWSHAFDEQVRTNCNHRFGRTCITNYMKKYGEKCPTCGATIHNLFAVISPVVVPAYTTYATYTPVYTPTIIEPVIIHPSPSLDIHVSI